MAKMKYLTRITADKRDILSQGISDLYDWHQALWKAFPGHDGERRSFLFRVDEKEKCFQIFLLSKLPVSKPNWGYWETKEISDSFLSHDKYRFKLRANPTKKSNKGDNKGKRVGLYKEAELQGWLERKASQAGFKTENFAVTKPVNEFFTKKGEKKNKLNRVDFEGILEVIDRKKFKTAFNEGIGSAKSLGFGMLIIAPIK